MDPRRRLGLVLDSCAAATLNIGHGSGAGETAESRYDRTPRVDNLEEVGSHALGYILNDTSACRRPASGPVLWVEKPKIPVIKSLRRGGGELEGGR